MSYTPDAIPDDCPPGIKAWLADQLRRVAAELARPQVDGVRLTILHAAPARYTDGDVIAADGTDWNPGSGAGAYIRRGGAWHFLG
jgi:hypothetical protein